jgi:RNA polymerase sigma factor (sigma-70 family)
VTFFNRRDERTTLTLRRRSPDNEPMDDPLGEGDAPDPQRHAAGDSAHREGSGVDNDPPDAVLVRGLVRGDPEALRPLLRRYDRLVRFAIYRTCRAYCTQDPDWLDARASETWTGFIRSMQRRGARPPDDLPNYLLQIARHKCSDAVRIGRALADRAALGEEAALVQLTDNNEDTSELVSRLDQLESLRACLAGLDAADRALCSQLNLIVERRWTEAAENLAMPESTLRTRWKGVLDQLRACIEKKSRRNRENPAPNGGSADSFQ